MLVVDDNMFKLAKMQEALLKVSGSNREENLNNYIKTVLEIDTRAYDDLLKEIKHIDEHNQTLENELQFLEKIKKTYDQLLELQMSFKRVCELYSDKELELSDLSQLNIEYIDDRINAITGYLTNLRNIDKNKEKLESLSDQLVIEEKKKISLDNKLLEMESILRNNFIYAEGRFIDNGKLQYASVISEYKELGFDFNKLLSDTVFLSDTLNEFEKKKVELSESVKAAEICYNSVLSLESKQILNEINKEFVLIKYKLVMLKILKILSCNYVEYEDVLKKREQLLDLINYRLSCMETLGIKISIDPFGRTKVREQLETILSLNDNSKTINKIRKEISLLSSRVDEMLKENSGYLAVLSDTRNLIESKVSFNDVDTTSIVFDFEDMLVKKEITPNQVVDIRNISDKLNMYIIGQKTSSVLKRVNQMINNKLEKEIEVKTNVVPELVIVPSASLEEEIKFDFDDEIREEEFQDSSLDEEDDIVVDLPLDMVEDVKVQTQHEEPLFVENADDMFVNVVPFVEPELFTDRSDESVTKNENADDQNNEISHLENMVDNEDSALQFDYTEEEMPDAFWVTQGEDTNDDDYVIPSFDEQVQMLINSENLGSSKTKKKVA